VAENTFAGAAYGNQEILERHRHRFEFNPKFRAELEEQGLVISGVSPDNTLVEIVELREHPWFLGCQFHPEFKSQPLNPHPLFREFIKASLQHSGA
jgi:CTP synthase